MQPDSSIHHLRCDYDHTPLTEARLDPDPVKQFRSWFEEARASDIPEPNAMTLGTADASGSTRDDVRTICRVHGE